MKRFVSLLLVLAFVFCGCGASKPSPEPTQEPTAIEQLTEKEKLLFDDIIKMSYYLHNPSAARVLTVSDYKERTKYDEKSEEYGPDTVIVRIQLQTASGAVGNEDFIFCLVGAENTSEKGKKEIAEIDKLLLLGKYSGAPEEDTYMLISSKYKYTGVAGEWSIYRDLGYSTGIEMPRRDASDTFDVKKINKAIKEYWEDMGF